MDLVRKAFYFFFPAIPKKVFNREGENMRSIMFIQTTIHLILFILNLVFVGFYPMLMELGYMTLAFTTYLTLREWLLGIYVISLISGGVYKYSEIALYTSTSLLFYVMEMVFLGLSAIYVGRVWLPFRLKGGRKEKYYAVNAQIETAAAAIKDTAKQMK